MFSENENIKLNIAHSYNYVENMELKDRKHISGWKRLLWVVSLQVTLLSI